MKAIYLVLVVGFVIVCFALANSLFVLTEGQQALITQFGQIRGAPITNAGLHFKIPFIQDVRYFDKRILTWDGDPEQIPTKDKKYIWVDTTARWRITELRKFAEAVQSEEGARNRLDGILDGITRDTISNHNLVEAVRNSNKIFDDLIENKELRQKLLEEGGPDAIAAAIEEEVTGDIERTVKGREQLSRLIVERSSQELLPFGIELIDVQLRRIAYEKSVEDKVYDRMISERNRIAEKIRSIGMGEQAKITGKLNRDRKEIESDAFRRSQEIKGKAEAEAADIYAKTLGQDASFYRFIRTLEAYKKSIATKGRLILSTDADFLKLLEKQP